MITMRTLLLILYRIYQICIMIPLLVVLTAITALSVIILCSLGGGDRCGYVGPHIWARLFCILTFVRVKVTGRENISNKKGYVFVANHQGAYDIFAIFGYLDHPFKWMMKASLIKIPLVGYSCKRAGHVFVDNSSAKAVVRTMDEARKRVEQGKSLCIFPEGSRTLDGHLQPFKTGAYKLAVRYSLPVVPLTINGSYEVLPRKGAILPHWGTIKLTIHPCIMPGKDGHDMRDLMERSREAIASALPPERQ